MNPEATPAKSKRIDVARVREDFPILHQEIYGKRLAYLDNAATTQKPVHVLDALRTYYESHNSNVHRSLHYLSEKATLGYEGARETVARFIHAPNPSSVIFTRGTTESINLVAHSWGRTHLSHGDEILITEFEHHSNIVPWQVLAKEKGAILRFVPMNDKGEMDLEAFHAELSERTRIVAVAHGSNVLGTINPIKQLAKAAHDVGAVMLVDAAQSVPHMPVDVFDLDCDFLAFSGHKMLGPTGIGVLYGKEQLLEAMEPYQAGGEMILKVQLHESTWNDIPHKFEAGTPNIAGAIGLGAAIDYLSSLGMEAIAAHEQELVNHTLDRLKEVQGLRLYGTAAERGGAISFELEHVHPHDLTQFVDREGVAIRAGHMCAQPLMRRLDVPALSRASLYLYNDETDIDQLVNALNKAKDFFSDD